LLYGELLPDGVSKVLLPSHLGGALSNANGALVLELGSGSGKVALQTFLQCPNVRRVFGVELVSSRHAIAENAMQRLAAALPNRFRISSHKAGESICLEEAVSGRRIEFHCADFFSKGLDETCEQCDAIYFAVHIPCRLFAQLCQRLACVKEGCRLFSYHALDTIWWIDHACPFQQCDANVPETDTFSTSWSPQGFRFYVYACDRKRPPQIVSQPRNETYSEWQAMWDEKSQSYYFHNQENETSQWEVPHQAGMWQAVWAEEHQAYYFWHAPTGHAQWEVPKCMGDLGWAAVEPAQ
jgi:SAM-dependent methyltransferase